PFALIGAHTSIVSLSVAMLVRGAGIGFAFIPAMSAAFAALDRSELPDATPQLNVLQRVGGSIGTAGLPGGVPRAFAGPPPLAGRAAASGRAFWWPPAVPALAIGRCVVLLRAERRARAAKAELAAVPAEAVAA